MTSSFAALLSERRRSCGLTQAMLARQSGCTRQHVAQLECGAQVIRFQIESRTCPGAILRGVHEKNTVLRRWTGIRRLSGCSGIGLKPYEKHGSPLEFDAGKSAELPCLQKPK
ncbi:helix-turn-helix transcriptional regulator [Deinococcus taklimakanensis]|uniref:Helix-turn-helix transcriptional regulator n=1 Tax=Deinococcus taklimakanensis TaxID=536443 RepID=A0ABW5P3F9_9DEIO